MNKYLFCYDKVYFDKIVGKGNRIVKNDKLDEELIIKVQNQIDKESRKHFNNEISSSTAIVSNIIKLDD